jgi:hypothetical protein
MTIQLTKAQVLRLKKLVLDEIDAAGYDGDKPEFSAWAEILEVLEHAEEQAD